MGSRPKAVIAWSSGKDAAWALHALRQSDDVELVGAVTTLTDEHDRVTMHGVREALLDRQLERLGLPARKVRIPTPCPNETYERLMGEAMDCYRVEGVTRVAFGDLFLEDIREYRDARLAQVGMAGLYPLWGRETPSLAREMIDGGLEAVITCVDPRALDRSFAGRRFDRDLLDRLPDGVDPCGERGELHSVVVAGPMLDRPIAVELGEVVEREGFVFADVIPS